jgi:hypothetical protein
MWPTINLAQEEANEFPNKEIEAINAVRAQGKLTVWPRGRNRSKGGARNKPQYLFCNLLGHMQKECQEQKASGDLLVDAKRKPYTLKVTSISATHTTAAPGSNLHPASKVAWITYGSANLN